ncbi:uncharacterized protein LOC131425338 [Malaya genurostris]|uniref:uncharacterized protein LOC131425338 n=1 Tax=Malaya genurostris TaxID=325434 RepID=UPI0026F39D85|nr:uncharacterized protein LOC131425338 [Malaya genurostris]
MTSSARFRDTNGIDAPYKLHGPLGDKKHGSNQNHQRQQKVNYSHNLQYLEIVSPPDKECHTSNTNPSGKSLPEVQSHLNLAQEVANQQHKQKRQDFYVQLKRQVCRNRLQTIRGMSQNPIYVNDNFERPWQTVSHISDRLVKELMVETAEQGLDFGEESFVEDFLRLQLGGG